MRKEAGKGVLRLHETKNPEGKGAVIGGVSKQSQTGRSRQPPSQQQAHTRGHLCVATVHYVRTAQHLCVSNVVGRVACEPAKTQSALSVEHKNLVTTDKAASPVENI